LQGFAIRWTRARLLTLFAVEKVQLATSGDTHSHRISRGSCRHFGADHNERIIHIAYSDQGGISRILQLHMPSSQEATRWIEGFQMLLKTAPDSASAAHWRWVYSCMAATSARGATGCVRLSELRSLLRRAHAANTLSSIALEEAVQSVKESEQQLELPNWLRGAAQPALVLDARQVGGLLLQLCTSSDHICEVFRRFAVADRMGSAEWLAFVRAEQLDPNHFQAEADLGDSAAPFKGSQEQRAPDRGLTLLQLALQLLGPGNDASAPARSPDATNGLVEPLTHYWTATSHNSYIVGDQLTGDSTAAAYRRQLLQMCRHVEIDCWDGASNNKPIVTHGHTFCSSEKFDEVALAVAECAFVTSKLPVILSLEMHCSPKQQAELAKSMIKRMEDRLLRHDELVATGRASLLSPQELTERILVKGKVVRGKVRESKSFGHRLRSASSRLRGTSSRGSARGESMGESIPEMRRSTSFEMDEDSLRYDSIRASAAEVKASATQQLDKRRISKRSTNEYYAECLSLRSLPASDFLSTAAPRWPLPITSFNEDKFLRLIGLSRLDCNQIEGLPSSGSSAGLSLSYRAIVRLAANPPQQVGTIQRRSACWSVRPYPLGLRFSGNNMSPLPGWLAGAQSVCINMSNIDLPLQLHFALFGLSGGFVLKPHEMRLVPREDLVTQSADIAYWPPPCEGLCRTTISLLSLHNLPKNREQRPRLNGSRGGSHQFVPQLSGASAPPDYLAPVSPKLSLSLHPVGGVCALSDSLPLSQSHETEFATPAIMGNGMNAPFNSTVHCVAAEPKATFLRIQVTDGGREIAFETAVLGRLRRGYRVFQLRDALGTRIEIAYLFVKISHGEVPNLWPSPREMLFRSQRYPQVSSSQRASSQGASSV